MRKITKLLFLLILFIYVPIFSQKLFFNGNIFPSDSSQKRNNYFIVNGDRFQDVGYSNNIQNQNKYSEIIDLKGLTVLPGFVDSHIHFIDGALGLLQINLMDVKNKNELTDSLIETKSDLIDGNYVARNLGFAALKNIQSPIKYLDSIFADIPAIIFIKSGHAAIANSAGMKKLNFDKNTEIENGEFRTDSEGNLNGWLLEAAAMEALKTIVNTYSQKTLVDAILFGQDKLLSYGITTIGDNTFSPFHLKIYQTLQTENKLKFRIWSRSYGRIPQTTDLMNGMGIQKLGFIGPKINFNKIHFHAIKYFEDMSLSVPSGSTHDLSPGGEIFLTKDNLIDLFLLNPKNNLAFHVQGKEGLDNIIDAINFTKDRIPYHRNVLDHVGYASPEQINEISKLNQSTTIIASQVFDYPHILSEYTNSKIPLVENDLMNNRLKYNIAKAAFTSDFPYGMDTSFTDYKNVDGLNPFPNLAVNTCGKFPDGTVIKGFENKTISVYDAIKSYTENGAYVLGLEDKIGKIKPGYFADFIIIDQDIEKLDSMELYSTKVNQTYINGEKVYDVNEKMVTDNNQKSFKSILPYDYSLSPIFGYDPSQSFIFGVAGFVFPLSTPSNYYDLQLMYSVNNQWNVQANYKRYGLTPNIDLTASGSYSNFAQYYFGELDTTKAENYDKIFAGNYFIKVNIENKLNQNFKINVFSEFKARKENHTENKTGTKLSHNLFPNEQALSLGIESQIDTRNNSNSAKKGFLLKLGLEYFPLNLPYKNNFWLVYGEGRFFKFIYNGNHVLALRTAAGTTLGKSNYLFRYNLGGANQLRGYYTNRFRGDEFLIGQLEYRWQFLNRFSAVIFTDAGYMNKKLFNNLLSTWGFGLRFFINSNAILRFDYGFGKDQNGLFFTFGEAF